MSLVLPKDSTIYRLFNRVVEEKRVVFVAGLPAVGKSLYLQQLAHLAATHARPVHLLQWDVARAAFERDGWLARYPEIDGVTHPAIRKAAGLWARQAIANWHSRTASGHILISELPLIGNRLIELVQKHDDEAERLLGSSQTHALIPVPDLVVREHLESARQRTISNPTHERERADAPPHVVEQLWQSVYTLAIQQGFVQREDVQSTAYDPVAYARTFDYLLSHRMHDIVNIDAVFSVSESVYELGVIESELTASSEEVRAQFASVEAHYTTVTLNNAIDKWWVIS